MYLQYLVLFTQVAAGWCLGWVETAFQLLNADKCKLSTHNIKVIIILALLMIITAKVTTQTITMKITNKMHYIN